MKDENTYFKPYSDLGSAHRQLYDRLRVNFAPPEVVKLDGDLPSYPPSLPRETKWSCSRVWAQLKAILNTLLSLLRYP